MKVGYGENRKPAMQRLQPSSGASQFGTMLAVNAGRGNGAVVLASYVQEDLMANLWSRAKIMAHLLLLPKLS
jgi:hypothetical protein